MTPQEKIAARVAALTQTAPDYTKTVSGGGEGTKFEALAAGACRLRLVSYVELGIHEKEWQGVKKKQDRVRLGFEVTGPKHPVREHEGKKYPNLVYIEETLSRHEKANFVKLFALLNYDGTSTHPLQLLGKAYLGTIVHRMYPKKGEPKDDATKWTGIDVGLRDKTGYNIRPPRFEDPETGDLRVIEVAEPIAPVVFFVWHDPDKEQWDSIFIDGEYPERKDEKTGKVLFPAKSKNFVQAKIMTAQNFKGSPIHELLAAGGQAFDFAAAGKAAADDEQDTGPTDTPPPVDEDDALAGVAAVTPARGKAPDLMGEPD